MKKIKKYLLSVFIAFIASFGLKAQISSLDAINSYKDYVLLSNQTSDKEQLYSSLLSVYKNLSSALNAASLSDPNIDVLKSELLEVYSDLEMAAIYYQKQGNQSKVTTYAQAFIDLSVMDKLAGVNLPYSTNYSTMAYLAAQEPYNRKDFKKAIPYLHIFLRSGETRNRQTIYQFLASAYSSIGDYRNCLSVIDEALAAFPDTYTLLALAVDCSISLENRSNILRYGSRALIMQPNDTKLLNIMGKAYEEQDDFSNALAAYSRLWNMGTHNFELACHIAINTYNMGALNYNNAILTTDESIRTGLYDEAKNYFNKAVSAIDNVLAYDSSSIKYMQAQAMAYSCLGDTDKFKSLNRQITMSGGQAIAADSTPQIMSYKESVQVAATPLVAGGSSSYATTTEIPKYSIYAKEYVETQLAEWQAKDEYETLAEYKARVNETTRDAKINSLLSEAERQYVKLYVPTLSTSDFTLKPYDADNQVFLIESKYGELVIPVPRTDNEARLFSSNWNGIQLKNPSYYISDDKVFLSSLTLVTPLGKVYEYDVKESLVYTETVVNVDLAQIDYSGLNSGKTVASKVSKQEITLGSSDVDMDIPMSLSENNRTFAVIIANEDYEAVASVPMAKNDGNSVREYCIRTLGIPENNVRFYSNASFGVMVRAIGELKDIAAAFEGNISVIFYYAGHGIPNEATKDAFLMPIDADGKHTDACYSLNRLYSELGQMNVNSCYVFLDACFSGASRDSEDKMLASARGIAIAPKVADPRGNMVIFSAASGNETALPYTDKGHGLFTYFLLKKLQETKGEATLEEIANYISQNVRQQSIVINHKSQTPTIIPSDSMVEVWKEFKLK